MHMLTRLLKNFKTGLAAAVVVGTMVAPYTGVITKEQATEIRAAAVAIGLVVAKDYNVTGGTKQQ